MFSRGYELKLFCLERRKVPLVNLSLHRVCTRDPEAKGNNLCDDLDLDLDQFWKEHMHVEAAFYQTTF